MLKLMLFTTSESQGENPGSTPRILAENTCCSSFSSEKQAKWVVKRGDILCPVSAWPVTGDLLEVTPSHEPLSSVLLHFFWCVL